jgi:hypothetical protein
MMGFYDAREAAVVVGLLHRVRRGKPAAAAEQASELAGEIVATGLPDETEDVTAVAPEPAESGPR